MLQAMRKHMRSNAGDSHVSKMTLIAVVFVVGAILLVLITSAFRNPINRWFDKVQASWFNDQNGEFNLMLNPLENYEKNTNGTYKEIKYGYINEYGNYICLKNPESLVFDTVVTNTYYTESYHDNWDKFGNGMSGGYSHTMHISEDGQVITMVNMWGKVVNTYTAIVPE